MSAIYIHVPYCKQKCAYCDFCSQTNYSTEKDYFDAVRSQIKIVADKSFRVDSVYFGGGTPSSVAANEICSTLNVIKDSFTLSFDVEITVECNPESVTEEKIKAYKDAGVNRISVGLQSAKDATLKKIGRLHTYEQAVKAIDLIHDCGIENINADLILGLPDEDENVFFESVFAAANLPLKHISIYSLEIYDNTPLGKNKDKFSFMNADEQAQAYYKAVQLLKTLHFSRYEISNFAQDGFECKHNLCYWKTHHYYGFGAAASGYIGNIRYTNTSDINEYVKDTREHVSAVCELDALSDHDTMFETVMLGLRLDEGINLSKFESKHGESFYDFCPKAKAFVQNGTLVEKNGRVAVSQDKIYVLNSILSEILD